MKSNSAVMEHPIEILIAENNPTQATQLEYLLTEAGYAVRVAKDGAQALTMVRERKPEVLFGNIVMPEMDGYALTNAIKADPNIRDISVVLMTSLAGAEEVLQALQCSADHFVSKPYEQSQILVLLTYILTNRELRKSGKMTRGVEIEVAGKRHLITSERLQILDLLLSIFIDAIHLNRELQKRQRDLAQWNEQLEAKVAERTATLIEEIAARKKAEKELRSNAERYQDLFENANDIIFTLDLQGNFTSMNRRGEQVTGYRTEEILGRNLAQFMAPELQQSIHGLKEMQFAAKPLAGLEVIFLRKDGRRLDLELSNRLICLQDGKPIGVHGIARDVSERKKLQLQLFQAQKMEAVGRLAGGVAHDFNNHLGVILGYSELLLDRFPPGDPIRKSVTVIQEAAQRSASLTRQLLAFGRRQVVEPKVLDLNLLISELHKMLQPMIGEDVELVVQLDPTLGKFCADPTQIDQIIMNLAVNARDAMPHGGRLTLQTSNCDLDEGDNSMHFSMQPGPFVMLSVSDTGAGMDKETQAQIFEPFFTTKEKGRGTGLGLAMVYGIVKQGGGYIWISSELGQGTTFKVYFPRMAEDIEITPAEPLAHPASTGWETVLVVEDEEMLRELVCDFLQETGYSVLQAGNGAEAMEISNRHQGPIHLLITDRVMPGISGRKLARKLETLRPDMKLLFVSGYGYDSVNRSGVLDLDAAFLQKPFSRGDLTHKVRTVLDGKEGGANGN